MGSLFFCPAIGAFYGFEPAVYPDGALAFGNFRLEGAVNVPVGQDLVQIAGEFLNHAIGIILTAATVREISVIHHRNIVGNTAFLQPVGIIGDVALDHVDLVAHGAGGVDDEHEACLL